MGSTRWWTSFATTFCSKRPRDMRPAVKLDSACGSGATPGRAEIAFARDPGGATYLRRQFASYPFHLCRPHHFAGDPPGMATLYLQSLSGGIYEDERLSLAVVAEPGAQAHVTSQASTIVHSMEAGGADLAVTIEAREDALVEYMPDPLILFPGARLSSALTIRRHGTAAVICADSFLTHDPEGEGRPFGALESRVDVRELGGGLLARDRFALSGETFGARRPADACGYAAQATVMVLSPGDRVSPVLDALRGALAGLAETYAGASLLPNDCGVWARLLSADGAALRASVDAVWGAAREALTGARPRSRRK
jgi:urease accessory protein